MASGAYAQAGVSSASASRIRSQAEQPQPAPAPSRRNAVGRPVYAPPPAPAAPDEIAVEEIINYHRHRLPLPKAGQGVAMEARWGNDVSAKGQPAVLQIGFTTAEFNDSTDTRPLNLALVIDHSGSMAAADKMSQVKQALQTLIGKLRPEDLVSIVIFDDTAEVVMASTLVGNGQAHRRAIDSIYPDGSTNINAGLMLGYEEVARNQREDYTNRVILLTDGIANTGETNPQRIADNSLRFNERGIDLSTIGVGQDLDNDLLKTLAKRGRGLYHFVADGRDVEKVFVSEVQSLLSPVARDARVEIESDAALGLEHIYGYEPRRNGNRVTIELDDMNNGVTQVIMLRYAPNGRTGRVTARLSYYDIEQKRRVEETQTVALNNGRGGDFLRDNEVRKNYTIAQIAQALSDMRESWQRNDYRAAERLIREAARETRSRYPRLEDKDIRAQLDVAENYLSTLQSYNFARRE
jgi:Mg-chelatase subunit ChlD